MQDQPQQWEMSPDEIKNQAGRHTDAEKAHPFEEGRQAALANYPKSSNPYKERTDWRRKPWADGWNKGVAEKAEQATSDQPAAGPQPEPPAGEEPPTNGKYKTKAKHVGGQGIQQSLNIPGDENDPLSDKAKEAALHYANSIITRVAASDDETKSRRACEQVMLEEGIDVLPLPNGGKFVKETINETTFHYESPKKKKVSKVETEGGSED